MHHCEVYWPCIIVGCAGRAAAVIGIVKVLKAAYNHVQCADWQYRYMCGRAYLCHSHQAQVEQLRCAPAHPSMRSAGWEGRGLRHLLGAPRCCCHLKQPWRQRWPAPPHLHQPESFAKHTFCAGGTPRQYGAWKATASWHCVHHHSRIIQLINHYSKTHRMGVRMVSTVEPRAQYSQAQHHLVSDVGTNQLQLHLHQSEP